MWAIDPRSLMASHHVCGEAIKGVASKAVTRVISKNSHCLLGIHNHELLY
jgi:hypothetical protein